MVMMRMTLALVWLLSWNATGLPIFTLHGLWPNPSSSTTTEPIDWRQLKPLMPWLSVYWSEDRSLLEHEWVKHGSRSGLTSILYFRLGLELYFLRDPTPRLLRHGIYPDRLRRHRRSRLVRNDVAASRQRRLLPALQERVIGGNPTLICNGRNFSRLSQVRSCHSAAPTVTNGQ